MWLLSYGFGIWDRGLWPENKKLIFEAWKKNSIFQAYGTEDCSNRLAFGPQDSMKDCTIFYERYVEIQVLRRGKFCRGERFKRKPSPWTRRRGEDGLGGTEVIENKDLQGETGKTAHQAEISERQWLMLPPWCSESSCLPLVGQCGQRSTRHFPRAPVPESSF